MGTTGEGRHHWFEDLADHLGATYLRYAFTRGTRAEVVALVEALGLVPGSLVLDVGCGPGRHVRELARRGMRVVGLDVAQRFLEVAAADPVPGASYVRGDARALPFPPVFDAVISLCQGGFGLLGGPAHDDAPLDPDGVVLDQVRAVLRPGGRLAMSAFSAYFQLRYLEEGDTFDAERGVNHERTSIRNDAGEAREVDLWTSCFTPRELRLLAARADLEVTAIWSVTPGAYRPAPPDIDQPELLVLARRP